MGKLYKALNGLKELLEEVSSDSFTDIDEIAIIQDWLDDNAVLFTEEYRTFISYLQAKLDDGILNQQEIEQIKSTIDFILSHR